MFGYVLFLLVISLALSPSGRGQLRGNRIALACLGLLALCYVGLIALSLNVENTVAHGDENASQSATGWFGRNWLYVALLGVATIVVLHVVIAGPVARQSAAATHTTPYPANPPSVLASRSTNQRGPSATRRPSLLKDKPKCYNTGSYVYA